MAEGTSVKAFISCLKKKGVQNKDWFVDNGHLAGKIWILNLSVFIRTGEGSGTFPESVRGGRVQRFIHHRSQLHRLFILLGRPTSEARPIKSSHSCPSACHLARSNQNALSFSPFLSFPLVPFIFISQFLCPPCRLINFPTSNEEWTCFSKIMTWSRGQSCKLNTRFGADPRQRKSFQIKAASVYVRVPSTVWLLVPIHPTNREHRPVTAAVTEQSASIESCDLHTKERKWCRLPR